MVIDSLAGFELALAPGFRADFRESLYRMIGALTGLGVTVMMTSEIEDALHRAALQPPRDLVPHRRDHPAALRRDATGSCGGC